MNYNITQFAKIYTTRFSSTYDKISRILFYVLDLPEFLIIL